MKFFDYVYYRVCMAYSSTADSSPEFAAVCVVSASQTFNILTFFSITEIIKQEKILNSAFGYIILGILVFGSMIFNYTRFIYRETNNYVKMKEKWNNENNRLLKGILVAVYIIFSILLYFGLSIYVGSNKDW